MTTEIKPLQIVQAFFEAINTGDFAKAGEFMAADHEYWGPMFSTKSPKDYFEQLAAFEMDFEVETQDLIVADNAVTHVALLKVISPVQAKIPTCEVFKIKDGKIATQLFYFDTALFPKG